MIVSLSKNISHYLCKNNIVSEDDMPIYQYGFEIIISTILDLLITFGIGCLLNMKLLSMLYYVIFVFIRQLTGGYHANTHLKCSLVFSTVSFITLGLTKLAVQTGQYNFTFYFILTVTSLAIIWAYSPVENPNKEMDEKQKKRNHILSCALSGILSISGCVLFEYSAASSMVIILTLFMISMLILISNLSEGGKKNEIR